MSVLAQRYDCRIITCVGTCVTAFGFVLSYFAPNLFYLYATFGLLGGIGFGFVFLPAIVSVGYYFEKKRAFATGIAVCGSGVGTFVLPPVIQYLIREYEWRVCVVYLAGITMLCIIFGSFFKPLRETVYLDEEEEEDQQEKTSQKPLLMRIKEARAAQWAQSDENLSEESPSGSQNSEPPPYSEVLSIIKLDEPSNDAAPKMFVSIEPLIQILLTLVSLPPFLQTNQEHIGAKGHHYLA